MCGRFAQSQTREEYLAYLADEAERDIAYDPEPIGRYNVAPGTKVLLLSERDEQLQLDQVQWGYAPGWWDKLPLINARVETAATRNSLTSFTVKTASQSSWPLSEAHHLNAETKPKVF